MGTSYKALLRAFVITSPTLHFTTYRCVISRKSRYGISWFNVFSQGMLTASTVAFIDYGLIGGYVHTCRRILYYYDFGTANQLVGALLSFWLPVICDTLGQIVTFFSAKGWLTINAPKRLSRSLHATLGSGSCVFPEFFSLLVRFTYCYTFNFQTLRS